MGLLSLFKKEKKPQPILNEEDSITLREIERKAYFEDAKKLVEARGKERAKNELTIKPKKSEWDIN